MGRKKPLRKDENAICICFDACYSGVGDIVDEMMDLTLCSLDHSSSFVVGN